MTTGCLGALRPERPAAPRVPLARYQRLRSSRPDEICDHIGRVFSPHDLDIEGDASRLSFVHNQVDLERVSFNFLDYGELESCVTIKCPPINRYVLVHFSLVGSCHFSYERSDFTLPAGHFVPLRPDTGFTVRLSPGYKHLTLRLDRAALEAALGKELGDPLRRPIEFAYRPSPIDGSGRALAALVETFCSEFDHSDTVLSLPRVSWRIEEMLMSVLLETTQHNYSEALHRPGHEPVPFYVRRAEEYIRTHAAEQITFDDIAEAAGVGSRSLHAGFRKHRGTTPMRMLKRYRLDAARQQLLSPSLGDESVTSIAMNCGFLHLSRFAAEYKARFNESPSETLRRRT